MTGTVLAAVALGLAALPAMLIVANLLAYRRPGPVGEAPPSVSLLIPARDEERSILGAVESALASRHVDLEVLVMDDHSADRTAAIVRELAARDPRVRLLSAPALPSGWCGKQHACLALARAARHPTLAFIDADVRLTPDGLRSMHGFLETSGADLVSGIPRQTTGTLLEKLVVPLIHFVLLGFLPLAGMRQSRRAAFAAGCGQLFLVRAEAYWKAGGHAAIKASRHDGINLPRAFRRAGLTTDLCDATRVASCRMYRGAREVWNGFVKNATEGMAAPAAIVPWTIMLFGGQVLPLLLLIAGAAFGADGLPLVPATTALLLAYGARALLTVRFGQSWTGALLHPVGVLLVLAIQWHALWRSLLGQETAWKGRVQLES